MSDLPPPTISHLKTIGLTGAIITCARNDCLHAKRLTWDQIGLPDETHFPEIVDRRRFTCGECGSRAVTVTPDWRAYRPQGTP